MSAELNPLMLNFILLQMGGLTADATVSQAFAPLNFMRGGEWMSLSRATSRARGPPRPLRPFPSSFRRGVGRKGMNRGEWEGGVRGDRRCVVEALTQD